MSPQQSIAHYKIVSKLGEGGMGAVYRATDTKLNRDVAIKVLPESFASDPDRLARFTREAQVLAALNHPNIAAIYGVENTAFVMELVEGESLRNILESGPLPLETALAYAAQIVEALEAAHERGIVHRDLKPANIMVTASGVVKVLDFGLATVTHGPAAASTDRANSPTLTMQATQAGVILGTAGYMSPEQAAGKPVDKRADIWSFGVVLWEMLTGRQLFTGETTSHVLADVLRGPIELDSLPRDTPGRIRTLLARCLDRNVRNRLRDIGEARVAIQSIGKEPRPVSAPASRRTSLVWPALAIVMLLFAVTLLFRDWRSSAKTISAAPLKATLELSPAERLMNYAFGRPSRTAMAFSPDGNMLVFAGAIGSTKQLYRRALDQAEATPIPGTEGGDTPFFSPDGKWIGFYAGGELKKVATGGGPAVAICKLGKLKWGAAWGAGDTIVFADGNLWQVPAEGGEPKILLKTNGVAYYGYSSPEFLPDGKTLLYAELFPGGWDKAEVGVLPAGGQPRVLFKGGVNPRYAAGGYLIYLQNGTLLAAPFDARRLEITDPAVPILDGVMQAVDEPDTDFESGLGQFAVSRTGTLVYAGGGIFPPSAASLVRFDRSGASVELKANVDEGYGLRLSPDGRRLARQFFVAGNRARSDIELYDLERGTATRLITDGDASWPLWSPDGRRLLFSDIPSKIIAVPADGEGGRETIVTGASQAVPVPGSWSKDGKWLAYLVESDGKSQIWVRPMADHGDPRLFLESTFSITDAEFSPDGKSIAYTSNETGSYEVYVQSFPGPGGRHRLSTAGGMNPSWNPTSHELFYLERPQPRLYRMMAVDVDTNDPFHAGVPRTLFTFKEGLGIGSSPARSYDVYPDGRHFIAAPSEFRPGPPVTGLHVVFNWFAELQRRASSGR